MFTNIVKKKILFGYKGRIEGFFLKFYSIDITFSNIYSISIIIGICVGAGEAPQAGAATPTTEPPSTPTAEVGLFIVYSFVVR